MATATATTTAKKNKFSAGVTRRTIGTLLVIPTLIGMTWIAAWNPDFNRQLDSVGGPLIILLVAVAVGIMILAEAGLSFLGFGIQQPDASWGLEVSAGREYIASAWWLVTMPGLAIMLTVLSLNILASSLRDTLDPLHRWRWSADQPGG